MRLLPYVLAVLFFFFSAGGAAAATALSAGQALHVLNRMTYGPQPGDIERVRHIGLQQYVEAQLDATAPAFSGAQAQRMHELASARIGAQPDEADELAREERLLRAIGSSRQLEEVLIGFWLEQAVRARASAPAEQARIAQQVRPHLFGAIGDLRAALAQAGLSIPRDRAILCRALAVWFVDDTPPRSLLRRMEHAWASHGGRQKDVLRVLFTSPEFLASARGGKRKDPLRLLASAARGGGLEVVNAAPLSRAQLRMEKGGMGEWRDVAAALAGGRLALAAEPPPRHRESSSAPPMRVVAPGAVSPATVSSPGQVAVEASTPSAAAMAAATPTPPLSAAVLIKSLGPAIPPELVVAMAAAPPQRSTVILLESAAFLHY